MKESLRIGKLVIKNFFDYYEEVGLDDENEFFPILKVIISAITDSQENKIKKEELEKQLIDYAKGIYISLWLMHAEENDEEFDLDLEQEEAAKNFENIYENV